MRDTHKSAMDRDGATATGAARMGRLHDNILGVCINDGLSTFRNYHCTLKATLWGDNGVEREHMNRAPHEYPIFGNRDWQSKDVS